MSSGVAALLLVLAFVGLLWFGHRALTRGANRDVADGAVALVFAAMLGPAALAVLLAT